MLSRPTPWRRGESLRRPSRHGYDFFVFLVVVVVESFFMVVSMFIFIDVSFFIPVSAGAGVIAGVVVVGDVESVVVLRVSFGLHAATASKAAITARRFIYDLLRSGGASSIKPRGPRTPSCPESARGKLLPPHTMSRPVRRPSVDATMGSAFAADSRPA